MMNCIDLSVLAVAPIKAVVADLLVSGCLFSIFHFKFFVR